LAVITENGLWIKDEINNHTNIINAKSIDQNKLIDISITQFNKEFDFIQNIEAKEADITSKNWLLINAETSMLNSNNKNYENLNFITNFDENKIKSLFSNLSSLTIFQLYKLKNDYKSLGYSTIEVDTHKLKIFSYPVYLMIMTIFSSIIMLNIKRDRPKIFNLILGILLSVVIYYINYFSNLLGENEKIPISIAIWMPQIILILLSLIGLVRINEK
jgi:lipopolysaccharide export system permease protein